MPRPTHSFSIPQFSGLNSSPTPSEIGDTQASTLENLRLHPRRGKYTQRPGQEPVASANLSPDQNLDMVAWHKLEGNVYLLAMHSGDLYDFNQVTPTIVSGGTNCFASEGETNSIWFNNKVILGNGIDSNKRFDGLDVIRDAVQQPDLGTMALADAGVSGHLRGTYTYKVAFLNGDGIEGEASVASTAISVANHHNVNITSIPVCPAGQNCSGRRLYRTVDSGATYYRLTQIDDNTTTSYTDSSPDTDLGDELDEGRTKFPPVRYLLEHEGRLFGSYCLSSSGDVFTLYVSDKFEHSVCRLITDVTTTVQGGRFQVNDPAAGTLTGLGSFGSVVVLFSGGKSWMFSGDQPSNFSLTKLSDVGCTSHRSVVSTRERLIWLSWDGVYQWTGGPIQRISDDIKELIDSIPASGMAEASALVYDGRYHLYFPEFSLTYALDNGAWTKDTSILTRDTAVSTYTSGSKPKVYGARYGEANIWQLETGDTDDGDGILCRYASKDFNFRGPARDTRIYNFSALFPSQATSQTVSGSLVRGTADTIKTATQDLSAVATTGASVVRFLQQAPEQARSEFHRVEFDCLSTTGEYQILAVSLEMETVE